VRRAGATLSAGRLGSGWCPCWLRPAPALGDTQTRNLTIHTTGSPQSEDVTCLVPAPDDSCTTLQISETGTVMSNLAGKGTSQLRLVRTFLANGCFTAEEFTTFTFAAGTISTHTAFPTICAPPKGLLFKADRVHQPVARGAGTGTRQGYLVEHYRLGLDVSQDAKSGWTVGLRATQCACRIVGADRDVRLRRRLWPHYRISLPHSRQRLTSRWRTTRRKSGASPHGRPCQARVPNEGGSWPHRGMHSPSWRSDPRRQSWSHRSIAIAITGARIREARCNSPSREDRVAVELPEPNQRSVAVLSPS
jgi:hypothetical protein